MASLAPYGTQPSMAAARLHAELGTDFTKPVRIFKIVQQLRIWLSTQPLGNLAGFYLRDADAAAIVINQSHPEDLQRYTCSHELGHHVLGHQSHLDDELDVVGSTRAAVQQERDAQAFAGHFLMPLGLVNRTLRRVGVHDSEQLTSVDAYILSRDIDVSFAAMVWRLRSMGRLTQGEAERFIKDGAAAAKRIMRGGPPPGNARNDLFMFDDETEEVRVRCRVGDELRFRLSETRSSGYVWQLARPDPAAPEVGTHEFAWDGSETLTADRGTAQQTTDYEQDRPTRQVAAETPQPPGDAQLGVRTTRDGALLAASPGIDEIQLRLTRPWLEEDDHSTIRATVRVAPEKTLNGYPPEQTNAHVARLAARGNSA